MTIQNLINKLEALPDKTLRVFVPRCESSPGHEILEEPFEAHTVQFDARGYEPLPGKNYWKTRPIPGPYVIIE